MTLCRNWSNKHAVARRVLKIITYRTLFQYIYVLLTVNLKPPLPEVKIWHRVFYIFYTWEIKLSILIIRFIRSTSTKNHTINILTVNFAPFIQYTVMLPNPYRNDTQFGNSSVHVTRQGTDPKNSNYFTSSVIKLQNTLKIVHLSGILLARETQHLHLQLQSR